MLRAALLLALLSAPLAAAGGPARALTVFAASSLTEALTDAAGRFEAAWPGVEVEVAFAGSSTLAVQILRGAPADAFVSADEAQMARVAEAGLLTAPPVPVATNALVAMAPADGPVRAFADLARPGMLVAIAAPQVPAGRYARRLLQDLEGIRDPGFAEAVLANVVTEEPNVRQAAAKAALGEVDAALVYRTDVAAFPGARAIEPPDLPGASGPLVAVYHAAPLAGASEPELAAAFVAFLRSDAGRAALAAHGFGPPEGPAGSP